jgi:hypothetical protein
MASEYQLLKKLVTLWEIYHFGINNEKWDMLSVFAP